MSGEQQVNTNAYSRIFAGVLGLAVGFGGTSLAFPAQDKPNLLVGGMADSGIAAPAMLKSSGNIDYPNCAAVRAADAAPLRRGQPGYGRHLDHDGDGRACE